MDFIRNTLLSWFLILLRIQGLSGESGVAQNATVWINEGEEAMMSCTHTKGVGYNYMYWFRQLPGETMELVVSTSLGLDDHDFGKFSQEKYAATKPAMESGTFTVKAAAPGDNGVYFCAVSKHSDADACDS
ncbi:uncharacterized protein V6R79_015338 [Siganus canaliculatus]